MGRFNNNALVVDFDSGCAVLLVYWGSYHYVVLS